MDGGCRAAIDTHLRNTPSERRLQRPGQVSWLAGRCRFRPAFPARSAPVDDGRRARRLQLRGQPRLRRMAPHRIPS